MGSSGTVILGFACVIAGIYFWLLTTGRVDPPGPAKEKVKVFFQDRKLSIRIVSFVLIFYGVLWASHVMDMLS